MTARGMTLGLGIAGIAAVAFAASIDVTPRLVFNGSRSAPLGFYTVSSTAAERGDLVLAAVPEQVRFLVAERHYLPLNVPLLKRIFAADGERICRSGEKVFVNGEVVASALAADFSGRSMPVWSGCRVLRPDEVLLLQDHPRSFDGRYFGAINRRLIMGKAAPVWLFGGANKQVNIREDR